MMAAYQQHPGGLQPGMPHAMPGMPPGGGQPMGHPMQMGGVSAGGNPHMGQAAAMMNMQGGAGMPGGMGVQGPAGGMSMPGQNFGGPGLNNMAMSHLNPQAPMMQQQHSQQQMQQQGQQNAQAMAQQRIYARQQQMIAQHQQQQQAQAQQQQHPQHQQQMNAMGMASNPAQMSMQQLAAMQNNPAFHAGQGLPQHQMLQLQQMGQMPQGAQMAQLRQHMAQQHAMQQSHNQAQQQQQSQQQNPAQQQSQQQPPQQTPQHPQQQQRAQQQQQQGQQAQQAQPPAQAPNVQQNMAHHVAMQHAPSQQSNHSAPGPGQQAQTPHSGQTRAQSQVPGGPDGPQAAQTPQTVPQSLPSTQPGQQAQQGNPQAQNLTPQQQREMLQQRQQQQHQQQQQQQHSMNMLRLQAASQAQAQAQAQQNRNNGTYILKLLSFSENLGAFHGDSPDNNLQGWHRFVQRFFCPDGTFTLKTVRSGNEGGMKQFTTPYPALPRFWWTHFESGVQNLQVKMEGSTQNALPNEYHHVSFERCQFIFWYKNGVPVIWSGKLNAVFPPNSDKLELMEFELSKFDEYVPKSEVARVISMSSPTMTRSPKLSKNTPKQRQMSKIKGMDALTMDDFPTAPLKEYGLPSQVVQFLEIGETMFLMQDVMDHAKSTGQRPASALSSLIQLIDEDDAQNSDSNGPNDSQQPSFGPTPQQQHQMMMQQRQASMGSSVAPNRTPMQAHMQLGQPHGFSPQVANMNIPMGMSHLNGPMTGSPHISQAQNPQLAMLQMQQQQMQQGGGMMGMPGMVGSPAPMAAPTMLPQHSQQGTSSSAASANTSPNVAAKRRRSTVKMEDENAGGADGGGANRVKASPRVGGNKKLKG